ncbi:MAG: adenosine deaminase [Coriobacteriia bacterium]|nr:adenosine deaminase [Coriobacteriia bacterium]
MANELRDFAHGLPKAELHLHLEGTLEPDLMFELAERNGVYLPYRTVEATREAYDFKNLQSFLDVYYAGCTALVTEQDFYDLTWAYVTKAAQENILHVEPFFDPQTHMKRGVSFGVVIAGILRALEDADEMFGVSFRLIMCFLRDEPVESAIHLLRTAHLYQSRIAGVGLDSAEVDFPPSLFEDVFRAASEQHYHRVAHAGEEGPPSYISDALDLLHAERIDHGVRCLEDPALVERLVRERVPLTVCPLSNVRLRVVETAADHPLRRMMDAGLMVTVNSDDPAYFGGYLTDNYVAMAEALELGRDDLVRLAKASFEASFLPEDRKAQLIAEVDAYAKAHIRS